MNQNQSSHFYNLPKLNVKRSRFNLDFSSLTSFNVGELVPLCKAIEVLPGDTFRWSTSSLVRMQTLIAPIMDNLFFDTFFFFVPFRIIWEHYTNFLGENDSSPWVNPTTYSIPQIQSPAGGWEVGTLADKFGYPVNTSILRTSALPFRAYSKIVKDWFYDENCQIPPDVPINDAQIDGSNGDNYVTDLCRGGKPFIAGKLHDLYTSVLPQPQKGNAVEIPLVGNLPVFAGDSHSFNNRPLQVMPINPISDYDPNQPHVLAASGNSSGSPQNLGTFSAASGTRQALFGVSNLYSDFSNAAAVTINDLRLAFQTQRLLERMARGGTRYYEILASQWGVTPPQGLIQRSEYLGGSRSDININSVVQTSASDDVTPQGNIAAYSVSTNFHRDFVKSFSEPGYIIALGCVRYFHSYSQGIPREYLRKDRFDFYNQAFAFIGEQPILNAEIYMQNEFNGEEILPERVINNQVFGYNEAWVHYRYMPNMVTGEMRTNVDNSLDVWHLGDKYNSLPRYSSNWIREDKSNVDRVLQVQSSSANQLFGDFYFKIDAIRPMPLFSVPGLIDHM